MEEQVEEIKEDVVSTATLTSLIVDLHTVLDAARNVIVKYQKRSNDIDIREKNILNRELINSQKEKELDVRKSHYDGIDDVIKLKEDAKALIDESHLRLKASVEAQSKLNESTEAQRKELSEKTLITQRESNALENNRKNIEQEVCKRVTKVLHDLGIVKPPVEKQG